jgi:phosphate transport system substrate-binding protein
MGVLMKKSLLLVIFLLLFSLIYSQDFLEYTGCGVVKAVFSQSLKTEFLKEHPNCKFEIVGKGDLYGIREAGSGISDLGGTCRHKLNIPEEKYANLVPFAWDAIVVVVHKDNPIQNITSAQLKKVLTGEIKNWKTLNGQNAIINLYIRKSKNSGVGRMTRELLFADPEVEYASNAKIFSSTTPLEAALESDKYGIAVTGIYSARLRKNLKIIKLDDVFPTNENIRRGIYPLYRPLYMVYNYEESSDLAKDFINLALSKKGQTLLRNDGIIPLDDAKNLWKPFEKKIKKAGQNIKL